MICNLCNAPGDWRFDGYQHTGEIDGGCCYRSLTCRRCNGTRYEDFECSKHTRSERIDIIAADCSCHLDGRRQSCDVHADERHGEDQ